MVYLPIAVSLGRLRPDLALARLGAGVGEEEREEGWVAAGAEISQIRKYGFGTPGLRGRARPCDMPGCRGMVCPSFSNGYFTHSVHMWLPVVALDPRRSVPEALHSASV